jgi:hypothetical protein
MLSLYSHQLQQCLSTLSEVRFPNMTTGRLPSVEGGIQPTIVDAKGDIIAATAADTPARLAVGANDTVLTADSSTATGLKWAAAAGGANFSLLNAGGTDLTGASTITVSSISGYDKFRILVRGASTASGSPAYQIRFNGDTGANYAQNQFRFRALASYATSAFDTYNDFAQTAMNIGAGSTNAGGDYDINIQLDGGNTAGLKMLDISSGGSPNTGNNFYLTWAQGFYSGTSAISSVSIISTSGDFDAGKIFVYASA